MRTNISGHHVEVTPAIRTYTETKLNRLERHFDHINQLNVILSVDKLRQKAEATVHVSGGEIFANAEEGDLYAAIDKLADKLDRQIVKHKEKLKGRGR